jgi:hypothetical protein
MNNFSKTTIITSLWLFNPIIACDKGPEFEFGESELIELMADVSETTWVVEQESIEYEIRFQLEKGEENFDEDAEESDFGMYLPQVELMATAQACGTRSFLAEAEACIDSTYLSVTGTVEVFDLENQKVVLEEQIDGAIHVMGLQLDNAEFWLQGEGSNFALTSNDGIIFEINDVSW